MLELVILLVSIAISSFLAFLALYANYRSATNRFFAKLVAITIAWLFTTYIALKVPEDIGIHMVRLTMALAVLQVYYLFHFVHTFPKAIAELSARWHTISRVAALVIIAIAMSPFMFTDLSDGKTIVGPGIVAFLIFAASHVGSSLFILVKKFKNSSGTLRSQLKFLTIGIVICFGLIALTNLGIVALYGNASIVNLTPFYTLILFGFIAYAILAYHLFDVRIFISRAIIYSTLLGIVMATYGLAIYLISSIVQTNRINNTLLASVVTAFLLAFSFEPIRQWISEKTDGWLYKKDYKLQEVTRSLSEQLTNAIGLDEGLDVVMRNLTETLHLEHAVTYVFQPGDLGKLEIKQSRQVGYTHPEKVSVNGEDLLVTYFSEHKKIVVTETLRQELQHLEETIEHDKKHKVHSLDGEVLRQYALKKALLKRLDEIDASVAIPLHLAA